MLRVEIAPEHVLHAVGAVEDADAQALRHLVQAVEEHRLALAIDVQALPQEVLVVEDVLVQAPGVFRQAQRGERPLPIGQIDRIDRRVADRQRRVFRIDVHGRDVKLEFGLGAQQQEAADAGNVHARHRRESGRGPSRCTRPAQISSVEPLIFSAARSGVLDRDRERRLQRAEVLVAADWSGPSSAAGDRCCPGAHHLDVAAGLLAVVAQRGS